MNLYRYYWESLGIIIGPECRRIINSTETQEKTSISNDVGKVSNISVLKSSQLVSIGRYYENITGHTDLIREKIDTSNLFGGWRYDYSFMEPFQYTEYLEGDYYNWHTDMTDVGIRMKDSDINQGLPIDIKGKVRKLTAIISLSDSNVNHGGELELQVGHNLEKSPTKIIDSLSSKGNMVVFPSYLWYRIKPLKGGSKSYLTTSVWGDPFK